jgi:GNAT superfamily N-acetyltransferase
MATSTDDAHPSALAITRLRSGRPDDAEVCGRICYEAFGAIAAAHGFPSDFPTPETAVGLLSTLLSHPGFYSVVAEVRGDVVGSNFLDERSPIVAVGPITVSPDMWDRGIGRTLMEDVVRRATEGRVPGIRLIQSTYHNRSLSLYSRLGFQVREPLACLQGSSTGLAISGYEVRRASTDDVASCNALCQRVHGHHRGGELADAVSQDSALVVEHGGRISGYSTGLAFFGHTVGESNEDVKALIGSASGFAGPGLLVPATNSDLLVWCLARGLRIVEPLTLMTAGLYSEPAGSYLPSILY